MQALVGAVGHMSFWATILIHLWQEVATVFLTMCDLRVWELSLVPSCKKVMFIAAGPLALPILWWLVYISTDQLILVSCHAPFWFIGDVLKSLKFPGRVKDLFCSLLFLPTRCVAIHPCFLNTLQHRPLLVDLVLTWLSGNHPKGSSEDKVRGPTCVLLKSPVPTSFSLSLHGVVSPVGLHHQAEFLEKVLFS